MHKKEIISLVILFVLSVFLRFQGLGYSNFYGDETKTLYLDKTIPAYKFLMDQRKGPIQFLVVWFMEKVSLGYDEFFVRAPFAVAGLSSVFVFYFLVKKMFGWKVSIISAFIFSISGFNIAFSRTAQYQSFLVLFGLLSVWMMLEAVDRKKSYLYLLSGLFLGLSFCSHYDAVFFLIPVSFVLAKNILNKKIDVREAFINFGLPLLLVVLPFYVPYFVQGYFQSNVVGYLQRRFSGSNYLENNSLYTFFVYNPGYIFSLLLLPGIFTAFDRRKKGIGFLLVWFFGGFITLEFLINSPGTHIHNYFIPLYIISGLGIYRIFESLKRKKLKYLYGLLVGLLVCSAFLISVFVYTPMFNKGYPWKPSQFLGVNFNPPRKDKYNLYLYGFPYNRGWGQISDFMKSQKGVRGVYTNDNDTVAEYYLLGFDYTIPGSNFIPHYYIHVFNNQEFTRETEAFYLDFLGNYEEVKDFFVGNELSAVIFKRKEALN